MFSAARVSDARLKRISETAAVFAAATTRIQSETMNLQATLESVPAGASPSPVSPRLRRLAWLSAAAAILFLVFLAGWHVSQASPYKSGSGFGYALGLAGGSTLLIMLLYPLRKRARFMQNWGPLKYWFRMHMIGGVAGPLLVLFHSTFGVGSLNAGVALTSMLLVVASGLVGRFLYRQIHHGLYGSEITLKELQQTLQQDLNALEPHLHTMPEASAEIRRFAALVSSPPAGWQQRTTHFLSLDWKRRLVRRRVRQFVNTSRSSGHADAASTHQHLRGLLKSIDATLRAAQQTAQFSTYERLFSLWHVIHIPFLCMLVITAVIHVVAVHVY
jgi:hypothetical protein